jgi:glycosyltransferase involved in cell wall biosynthesis
MNICMIIHNSATRDGRVMREAHTLRAAGNSVTVIGIPEAAAPEPVEQLTDGVVVRRIIWHPDARRRLLKSAIPRSLLFVTLTGASAYAVYRLTTWLLSVTGFAAALKTDPGEVLGILAGLVLVIGISAYVVGIALQARKARNDAIRRQVIAGDVRDRTAIRFPAIRSRIPDWMPDWLLEIAVEPLDWFGAKTGRFSMYRYRSEALAAAAVALKPDVVHCHDCVALPTGWLVKKSLGIPLVYDAHEIYEAVAARRFGATDYFARIHRRYLPLIDSFIAVNASAATYYRHAYPAAPSAIVIRNATDSTPDKAYGGELHAAAGLPQSERILLYQGGFTKDRGLQTLIRAAPLLPDGWSLVMMGKGPLTAELKTLAAELAGGEAKTRFVKAVPPQDLLNWTQGATVGIVPYEDKMLNHWIATPNKLWEYPRAGVPMIVQPFPEMLRIIDTYRCGWALPMEFSAAAIALLVASLTEEAIADARVGCSRFTENDNWHRTYEPRLLNLYADLERRFLRQSTHSNGLSPVHAII